MWTQVVGKVRLECMPWINHSWHVPLYMTPVGMTTSTLHLGPRTFEVEFDFVAQELLIKDSEGRRRVVALEPRTVASFYEEFMGHLGDLDLPIRINTLPNEVEDPMPFPEDTVHASYDPEAAIRFSRVLNQSARVFTEFRSRFLGKTSPVHFFWGSFDLAVTRFSGRTAPPHPGGIPGLPDWVTREAYSHEVYSCGFWPGSPASPGAAFYAYAYPVPDALGRARVTPDAAFWSDEMGEFFLPYDAVRAGSDPDQVLMSFLESTYDAAADLADWDRDALEVPEGFPRSS
jgi:hypothetical protein